MKYTQGYKRLKFKFNAGFYLVVACCLLIVGGASYFAVSKISNTTVTPTPQKTESKGEYKDNTSSYIESTPKIPEIKVESEVTAQDTQKVPYDESKVETNQPEFKFTMPVQGEILKEHSTDRLQFSATYGDMRIHRGIDIGCEKGANVYAMSDGIIVSVERDAVLGTKIRIDHGNDIEVEYSCLSDISLTAGDTVKMGDVIGKSDTVPDECSDKNHIHIEVFKDNKSVDPLKTVGLN